MQYTEKESIALIRDKGYDRKKDIKTVMNITGRALTTVEHDFLAATNNCETYAEYNAQQTKIKANYKLSALASFTDKQLKDELVGRGWKVTLE